MKAINELKRLSFEADVKKYPDIPREWIPSPSYIDKTANGLTRCIIDWIKLNGGQAERISVTGRIVNGKQTVTDCLGHQREIGSNKWIPGTMTKGTADISATIRGKSVKIEVKIGADRQSEAQKKYQQDIERAGGVYVIAKDFQHFYELYHAL